MLPATTRLLINTLTFIDPITHTIDDYRFDGLHKEVPMDLQLEPETMAHLGRLQVDLQKEFSGIFSPETIARFVNESTEQFSGVKIQAYVPVLVKRFTRERLRAYGQGQGIIKKEVPEVLFVCTHNAGRSQMAMAFLVKAAEGRV